MKFFFDIANAEPLGTGFSEVGVHPHSLGHAIWGPHPDAKLGHNRILRNVPAEKWFSEAPRLALAAGPGTRWVVAGVRAELDPSESGQELADQLDEANLEIARLKKFEGSAAEIESLKAELAATKEKLAEAHELIAAVGPQEKPKEAPVTP